MASMKLDLRIAAARLASEADDQVEYLMQLGTAPLADELALEFSDALAVARKDLEASVATAADRLEEFLTRISGQRNSQLWTTEALRDAPEWRTVRDLAKDLLDRLPTGKK